MEQEILQLEYNNIKQEIFTLMQRCDNLIVAIFTVSVSLIGLGYELNNAIFFILTVIFIIPMQGLLNVRRYHMARCSIYIRLFLEPCFEKLRWETIVGDVDSKFKVLYTKENRVHRLASFFVGAGSGIISFISLVSYINNRMIINGYLICFSYIDTIIMIFMLICFFVIFLLSKDYVDYTKICQKYEKIYKNILNDEV
ncbi:MAG: hypothetical protein J6D02_03230 [Lachnospira sp.]|nr:hypothetical protein [Lachnospira sp.]